jgi:hypothetical protein
MKKVSLLALAAFAAAFTAYKAFDSLAKSLEDADLNWNEEDDQQSI